jgi:N,N'-diacetyllegionaminate synthase
MNALVIAEAGVNHNGSLARAKELVARASEAGADLVKFQSFITGKSIARSAPKAAYQIGATGAGESQYEMVRKLELSADDHVALIDCCRAHGIGFLSTAFDTESLDLLLSLGLDRVKIPSGELTNLPFLRALARPGLPVIMSTGMATLGDIEAAIGALETTGLMRERITLLHCNTEYPTPMQDVNLRAMVNLGRAFGVPVGYSDHTQGIEVPIAAVTLGATVIEKHFTLDRSLPGPDHQASLEPGELRAMVRAIRNIERALGDGIKRPSPSEAKNIAIARKSLVAARPIRAGECFSADNLTVKRPGTGVSPMSWDDYIGRVSPRDYAEDEPIQP